MKVFVTGGSGFVGRHLIQALIGRDDEVMALARSDAAARTLFMMGAQPVRGDLDDLAALQAGMADCERVFHSAAMVGLWGDPALVRRVNVEGTAHVLEAARRTGVRRLVHVSTEAVLVGGGPIRNADETRPRAARPIGIYPRSKGEAEALVLRSAAEDGPATMVCRPRMVWGKGDTTVWPQMLKTMRKGQWRWIDGGHYRSSTCHVRNAVEGLLLAADYGRSGEIYFLTDGVPVEFREFVTRQAQAFGVDPGSASISRGAAYALATALETAWRLLRLRGEPLLTRSSILLAGEEVTVNDAKARRELGYVGKVSLEQGLEELP